MKLARVVGSVVSPVQHAALEGKRLLLCDLLDAHGDPDGRHLIAVDVVGAGPGETVVLLDEGTSARQITGDPPGPLRTVVAGIVDQIEDDGTWRA